MARKRAEKIDKISSINSRYFRNGDEGSDNLSNNHAQFIEFYHVPSSYFVSFKAFLINFTDAYQSEWKRTPVYGRMDDVATFKKTSRKIDVSLAVPAATYQEAHQNMTRMSALVQMLYPSIDTVGMSSMEAPSGKENSEQISIIKGSPLFKVKFMNWIKSTSYEATMSEAGVGLKSGEIGLDAASSGLLGYMDGFTFAPDLEMGVFQAGLSVYPKLMTVVFTFNVIHEHELGWEKGNVKNKMNTNPVNENFPYGNRVFVDATAKKDKRTAKQAKRFKELQAAQNKMLEGV